MRSTPYARTSCSSRAIRTAGARQIVPGQAASHLNDPQQARLSRSVPADECDALAWFDPKVGLVEERQVAEGQRHRLVKGQDESLSSCVRYNNRRASTAQTA